MARRAGRGGRGGSYGGSTRGGRGFSFGGQNRYKPGRPKNLNYRSGSYGLPYGPPMRTGRYDGRGFLKSPAGRYINPYTGQAGGKGPRVFQPGIYVNSGRDRGSTFIPYVGGARTPYRSGGASSKQRSGDSSPPDNAPSPAPEPAPEPAPTPRGRRGIRIRNSPARRTAVSRGRRARGSRRSARVDRSIGGLSIAGRSGITV